MKYRIKIKGEKTKIIRINLTVIILKEIKIVAVRMYLNKL